MTNEDPQSKRFDKSRRLFENTDDNRQENEIARKQREAKEKDMQVIIMLFIFLVTGELGLLLNQIFVNS